jgi:hypothetical protein
MLATCQRHTSAPPLLAGAAHSRGQRVQLAEVAVFGVKDDKIISETFFISDQSKLIE